MKKKIFANWKMNLVSEDIKNFFCHWEELQAPIHIFAPSVYLPLCQSYITHQPWITLGAQNFYPEAQGSYTGEIGLNMLKDIGLHSVLIGHSERRHLLGESEDFLEKKLLFAAHHGFEITYCIGDTEPHTVAPLQRLLKHYPKCNLSIAYEPPTAIGTQQAASQDSIETALTTLEHLLPYPDLSLLYGGSVMPENAASIFSLKALAGVLVGKASLDPISLGKICAQAPLYLK